MGGGNTPTQSSYPKLAVRPVGKQIEHIYRDRLGQFTDGGQYYHQSLLSKLYNQREESSKYVKVCDPLAETSSAVCLRQLEEQSRAEHYWRLHRCFHSD